MEFWIEALAAALWEQDPERGSWSEAPDYWRQGYTDNAERALTALITLG